MGPIPPFIFKENDIPRYEDNIMTNGDDFEENINFESEDEDEDEDENEEEEEEDEDEYKDEDEDEDENEDEDEDERGNRGNINLEDENDIIPNDDAFRGYNYFPGGDIILDNNGFAGSNENEDDRAPLDTLLFTPSLEYIKNVLYDALHQFFDEFEIAVVSCPCLTKPPYNFAAAGLSGNTGILEVGETCNFIPNPQTDFVFDIQPLLSSYCNDFFVIGSGFATKPSMPYNGHLIMNAITSANPANVINNSRIVYEDVNGQGKCEIINDPNQMKCSMLGNFFFSEGRRGTVIKMRAKGRKIFHDVISLIQYSLYFCCQYTIGLGGVLVVNGGQAALHIIPENFTDLYTPHMHFSRWLKLYRLNCMNLIAVGALTNVPFVIGQKDDKSPMLGTRYRFNIFSNCKTAGGFRTDDTPDETEYIGYFNIAQRMYC